MTLAIVIISFSIVFYLNKKNKSEEKMHESFLLILLFLASVIWFIKSLIDLYRYGILVFSPNQSVFIKDIMTGIIVVATCMVLWVIYVVVSDKKENKNNELLNIIDNNKIEIDNPPSHQAPSITIDDYTKESPFNPYSGYNHYER